MSNDRLSCNVCFHQCSLAPGQLGLCKSRKNNGEEIVSTNYGLLTSLALDPIEKKPLNHYYPGSNILSVGSFGCNFKCAFCQNHQISMTDGSDLRLIQASPLDLVNKAIELKPYNNIGIAFTYNEPLIGYEFVLDTEKLAHENGLKTVVVTNGCINPEIFSEIADYTDAFNIDLKGIDLYQKVSGDLETVKKNIQIAVEKEKHVEVTTLVIPGENDSIEDIETIAQFLSSLDPNIVLHITRFFPQYKMLDKQPTDIDKMITLQKRAQKYLNNVYLGNV